MSLYDDKNYIAPHNGAMSEAMGTYALREAWKRVYNEYPSDESLAVLWAKTCLETGRFKVGFWNYNFGNIKAKAGEKFTMFTCGEELSLEYTLKEQKKHPDLVVINKRYSWSNGSKRASVTFKPPHYQTVFRAYDSLEDGAEGYLRFVSQKKRYMAAFELLKQGKPVEYAYALHKAGYYTADPKRYSGTVVKLFDEFMRRKEELLSWKPEEESLPDTDPAPPMEDTSDTDPSPAPEDPEDNIDTVVENVIPEAPKDVKITEVQDEDGKKVVEAKSTVEYEDDKEGRSFGIVAIIAVGVAAAWTAIAEFFQGCSPF